MGNVCMYSTIAAGSPCIILPLQECYEFSDHASHEYSGRRGKMEDSGKTDVRGEVSSVVVYGGRALIGIGIGIGIRMSIITPFASFS